MSVKNWEMAIAYDANNDSILLFGGRWSSQQLAIFKNNIFHFDDTFLTFEQKAYGYSQFYTQIDHVLWYINKNGNGFFTINTNTHTVQNPSITIPNSVGFGGCLTHFNNHLIVIGGDDGEGLISFDTVLILRMHDSVWYNPLYSPSLNYPRSSLSCVVVNDMVYAIGGFDWDAFVAYDDIETLDVSDVGAISAKGWNILSGRLNVSRDGTRAVVVDTDIYVIGGWDIDLNELTDVNIIDTLTGNCYVGDTLAFATSFAASILVRNTLYAFGGCDPDASAACSGYNKYQYTIFPTFQPTSEPTASTMNPTTAYPTSTPTSDTLSPSQPPVAAPTSTINTTQSPDITTTSSPVDTTKSTTGLTTVNTVIDTTSSSVVDTTTNTNAVSATVDTQQRTTADVTTTVDSFTTVVSEPRTTTTVLPATSTTYTTIATTDDVNEGIVHEETSPTQTSSTVEQESVPAVSPISEKMVLMVGGATGGVVCLCAVLLFAVSCCRKRHKKHEEKNMQIRADSEGHLPGDIHRARPPQQRMVGSLAPVNSFSNAPLSAIEPGSSSNNFNVIGGNGTDFPVQCASADSTCAALPMNAMRTDDILQAINVTAGILEAMDAPAEVHDDNADIALPMRVMTDHGGADGEIVNAINRTAGAGEAKPEGNNDDDDEDVLAAVNKSYETAGGAIMAFEVQEDDGDVLVMEHGSGAMDHDAARPQALMTAGGDAMGGTAVQSGEEETDDFDNPLKINIEGGNADYNVDSEGAKEVREWLDSIGYGMYSDVFIQNAFDSMDLIKEIKEIDDLKGIGISLRAHQLKIVNEIRKLKQ